MRPARLACLLALLVAGLVAAAPAQGSRLETWTVTSRFVDPAKVQFNHPPPGPPQLRVNVLLPDGYDGKRRFPVLYLLHGHGDNYADWADPEKGNVAQIAKDLGAIVVMPEGGRGWYVNWWNGGRRAEPAWERFYLEELVPLVERRLRILPGRRYRAIAGLSMGGEGAAFFAAQRPGYFGSLAVFSGAISLQRPEWPAGFDTQGERHQDVFGDPEDQRFYWTGHNPTALTDNLRYTRTFVAVGDGTPTSPGELTNTFGAVAEAELRQHAEDFVAAARRSGVDVIYRPQAGIHDWPYWRTHLSQAIGWGLFAPVAERPTRWSFQTVAARSQPWGLRFSFFRPPEELVTFKLDGRVLTATGSGRVRVRGDFKRFDAALPFTRTLPKPRRRR